MSFKKIETKENLINHISYYKALSQWVVDNKACFADSVLKDSKLDILLKLEPDKYVTNNCGILLDCEAKRIFDKKPKHVESLAESIRFTLWNMVTIHSGVDCPNCIYDGGLLYVVIESENLPKKEIAFQCELCQRILSLDGKEISEKDLTVIPANKEDVTTLSSKS